MKENNFYDIFFNVFSRQLSQNPLIITIAFDFKSGKGLKKEEINNYEETQKIVFPIKLKEIFKSCNGIQIKWKIANGEEEKIPDLENSAYNSSVRLLQMEEILGGWKGEGWKNDIWFEGNDYSGKKQIVKDLRPFDYYDGDDSGCACFLYQGGKLIDNVYTNSVEDGVHDLRINFEQYIDLMLMCYGVSGWQTALHTPEPKKTDYYHARRMKILKNLHVLVPDFDFENFMATVKRYQNGK